MYPKSHFRYFRVSAIVNHFLIHSCYQTNTLCILKLMYPTRATVWNRICSFLTSTRFWGVRIVGLNEINHTDFTISESRSIIQDERYCFFNSDGVIIFVWLLKWTELFFQHVYMWSNFIPSTFPDKMHNFSTFCTNIRWFYLCHMTSRALEYIRVTYHQLF